MNSLDSKCIQGAPCVQSILKCACVREGYTMGNLKMVFPWSKIQTHSSTTRRFLTKEG